MTCKVRTNCTILDNAWSCSCCVGLVYSKRINGTVRDSMNWESNEHRYGKWQCVSEGCLLLKSLASGQQAGQALCVLHGLPAKLGWVCTFVSVADTYTSITQYSRAYTQIQVTVLACLLWYSQQKWACAQDHGWGLISLCHISFLVVTACSTYVTKAQLVSLHCLQSCIMTPWWFWTQKQALMVKVIRRTLNAFTESLTATMNRILLKSVNVCSIVLFLSYSCLNQLSHTHFPYQLRCIYKGMSTCYLSV